MNANLARSERGTREAPIVVERIDDVDALLATPGYYQTASAFPAYLVAKALDGWHPLFEGGMDLPFVEGNIFFFRILAEPTKHLFPGAVPEGEMIDTVSLRSNPLVAMGVSQDFWSKLLQRYSNWELAWWREVAQNSRDARATQMDFSVVPGRYKDIETGLEAEAMVVTAYDNGGGMDADTLRRALLTRGGSVKPENAVGGFGDAKNLILFPWLGWKVETRDLVAFGQHESVLEPPGIHSSGAPIQGTRITVWMPLTQTTSETYAQQLLGRSNLPGVRVRVNGKTVAADLIGGEEIAKADIQDNAGTVVGEIVAHHHPGARANKGIYVRARGVYMFEEWAAKVPGVVYIDVNAPARLVFDASRNALIGAARTFVGIIKERLAKEPEALLRSKKWKAEKVFRGTGAISAREGRAAEVAAKAVARVADQLAKRQAQKKGPGAEAIKAIVEEIRTSFEEDKRTPTTPEEETAQRAQSSRETATSLVAHAAAHAATTEQVATAVRFAMWKPDLYVINAIPFWKMPASLEPESMDAKSIVLLRAWTEACKFTLNALGEFRPFGVGFVMILDGLENEPVLGAYKRHEGTDWLLINPMKFKRGSYNAEAREYEWSADGERFDMSSDEDIEDLCSIAVHEVTHLQGFQDHDPPYASQLTRNMKAAHRGLFDFVKEQVKTIRRETRERFAEIRQAKAEQKTVPWPLIVGRVTALLEWWTGLSSSGQHEINEESGVIGTIARDAGRHPEHIAAEIPRLKLLASEQRPWRDLMVKPKKIVELHMAAAEAGAFRDLPNELAETFVKVWETVPEDPRVRVRHAKPEGMEVFSWTRSGGDWVLREGYAGQRGGEVTRFTGDTGYYDRSRMRTDATTSAIVAYLEKAGRRWPGSENVYVWYMASAKEWYLRLHNDGRAASNEDDADTVLKADESGDYTYIWDAGDWITNARDRQRRGGIAEAQKYVMDLVVRRRAGG